MDASKRTALFAVTLTALSTALVPAAFAAPAVVQTAATASALVLSHASLRVSFTEKQAWVGQAIPVAVTATFHDVDGVTLEGTPQLKSDAVFTADLSKEPHQTQAVVNGEPVLVATWTGTITPSTEGLLALSVELPVELRYREAVPVPEAASPTEDDPLRDFMNADPFDPNSVQKLFRSFNQSFGQFGPTLGRTHDEERTLKTTAHAVKISALPLADQPRTFTGAVGHFDVHASLPAATVRASDPVTLTVTVQGDGDLDRVELAGLETSRDFKAYPPTAKTDAHAPGKRVAKKTFEQVLIPLHGGHVTVPPIAFSAFDPVTSHYVTDQTAPIALDVEGSAAPALAIAPNVPASPAIAPNDTPAVNTLPPPPPRALVVSARELAASLAPILAVLFGALALRLWPKRDEERSLRRALRRAARAGSAPGFFDAARRLIIVHFSKRWRVKESDVTPETLREHLGDAAAPLVSAISTAEALRFGRRRVEPTELARVCSSIERTLKEAA